MYPFEFKTRFSGEVLAITLVNGDKKSKIELYGLNKDEFDLGRERIKGYLDMMFEAGVEALTENPMPSIKVFDDTKYDWETGEFMKKVLSICDPVTAKQLVLRMWGTKK